MAINYDLNNTGPEVQARLDQVFPNQEAISTEGQTRAEADAAMREEMRAYTDAEKDRAQEAETALADRATALEEQVGSGGSIDTRIADAVDAEAQRAQQAEASLLSLYEGLTQSDIVPGPLPETGEERTIYRVPGESSYADYMWNGSGFVKMAEYDNAIDNQASPGSGNLITSGGVYAEARKIVNSYTTSGTDLDVADESGNVLMRLANGHVKTKNFDSSKNALSEADVAKVAGIEEGAQANDVTTNDTESGDLEFSDEKGNVVMRLANGHVKTKNFDSSSIFPVASISMFARIGILGASWDAGYFYTNSGTTRHDFNYSWLANACRRNGVEALNFAHAGLTTRRWLGLDPSYPTDAQYGIDRLLEQTGSKYVNKCNLYIINFLGNDIKLGLSYLGSLSDINISNPESNPDTFYGNYGKIVAAIKTVNPNCRIICAGLYVEGVHDSVRLAFKEAVDNIARFYGFGRLNWEYDNFYKSLANSSELIGNHPTISQLSGMAVSFENCFSKCVSEHRAYFDSYYEDAFN